MYSIELYLEDQAAALVRAMWQQLADEGISSVMLDNGSQPHVTLGVFGEMEIEAAIDRLDPFFDAAEVPAVAFEVLGTFPAVGVLHCTPTVSTSLLALHHEFHRAVAPAVSQPRAHYLPEEWVPHCTLAFDLDPEPRGQGLTAVIPMWHIFQSRFRAAALVKPTPTRVDELWVKDIGG